MRAKIEVAALRLYTTHRLYKAKDPVDLLATRRGILFHENERFTALSSKDMKWKEFSEKHSLSAVSLHQGTVSGRVWIWNEWHNPGFQQIISNKIHVLMFRS